MTNWPYRFFTPDEMRCKGTGLLRMHPGFMEKLEALRLEFGRPMVPTSACRAKSHNDRPKSQGGAGGHLRSLHVGDHPQHPGQAGCLAVDIATYDGAYRGALYSLAWRHGWSIGEGNGFLHLDRRDMVGLRQTTFPY